MEHTKRPQAGAAGTGEKSDCEVRYEPGEAALAVRVESSALALFGRAIEAAARTAAGTCACDSGTLFVKDSGALDYVVEARVEAALRLSGYAPPARAPVDADRARQPSPRGRQRRSRLYLPGDQPGLLINAALFHADCILLDLEDSVLYERRREARILVRRALETRRAFFGESEILVRVNALSDPLGLEDLEEVVPAFPQGLVLPKCESAEDLRAWDAEVSRLEAEHGIRPGSILFLPLIETARGVANALAIALASPRNSALCFGAEDYARDMGIERTPEGSETRVARTLLAIAARAAGIQANDSVYSDADDEAGLFSATMESRRLGFSGRGLVHPRQVAVVHAAFAPTEHEIEKARRTVAAYEASAQEGRGTAALDGGMVDAPVVERARRVLASLSSKRTGS